MKPIEDTVMELSVINPVTGCHDWIGKKDRDGYGQIHRIVNGKHINKPVHRALYESVYGNQDSDLVVMHTCDNPSCVNIDHLRLGTQLDNMRDMIAKGRQVHGNKYIVKLSHVKASEIRLKHSIGTSIRKLSREYGICPSTIRKVLAHTTWKTPHSPAQE